MYVFVLSTAGDSDIFRSDKYLTSYSRDKGINTNRSQSVRYFCTIQTRLVDINKFYCNSVA